MAFSTPVDPFPPERSNDTNKDTLERFNQYRVPQTVNAGVAQIITTPQRAVALERNVITWKTPYFGYIQMYINPQNISITHSKIIQTQRTKGGFVIQYGGENLDEITLNGHTGSSGMEGINILYSIYRAEQFGFESSAIALEQELASTEVSQTIGGLVPGLNGILGSTARAFSQTQPRPTLASLAASVEMFFQGVLYRGFFKTFKVDENADKPGWFNYDLTFTAYARQGVRRNFMPWHRQPVGPAGKNPLNELSFTEMEDPLDLNKPRPRNQGVGPSPFTPKPTRQFNRSIATAASITGRNLE